MEKLKQNIQKSASGESPLAYDPTGADQPHLSWIDIDRIDLDPNQPRKELGDLSELAASIAEHGIITPLVVQRGEDRRYQLIAGERRYRAAQQAEQTQVPCVVRTVEEHKKLEFQLVENLHRKDLDPVEEARSYERLMADFNYDQKTLAKHLGKSHSGINEVLRILQLPEEIQQDMTKSSESISKSLLLEIAKHQDAELQKHLWKQAKNGTLTVRKAREAKKPGKSGGAAEQSQKDSTEGRTTLPKQAYDLSSQKVTVIVQSKEGDLPQKRIIESLEEALRIAKKEG